MARGSAASAVLGPAPGRGRALVYTLAVAAFASRPSQDVGWLALVVGVLLLLTLLSRGLGRRGEWLERIVLYIGAAMAVFLDHVTTERVDALQGVKWGVPAAANGLGRRANPPFDSTPVRRDGPGCPDHVCRRGRAAVAGPCRWSQRPGALICEVRGRVYAIELFARVRAAGARWLSVFVLLRCRDRARVALEPLEFTWLVPAACCAPPGVPSA